MNNGRRLGIQRRDNRPSSFSRISVSQYDYANPIEAHDVHNRRMRRHSRVTVLLLILALLLVAVLSLS